MLSGLLTLVEQSYLGILTGGTCCTTDNCHSLDYYSLLATPPFVQGCREWDNLLSIDQGNGWALNCLMLTFPRSPWGLSLTNKPYSSKRPSEHFNWNKHQLIKSIKNYHSKRKKLTGSLQTCFLHQLKPHHRRRHVQHSRHSFFRLFIGNLICSLESKNGIGPIPNKNTGTVSQLKYFKSSMIGENGYICGKMLQNKLFLLK